MPVSEEEQHKLGVEPSSRVVRFQSNAPPGNVGATVGDAVGATVGDAVGATVGGGVGTPVGVGDGDKPA